MELFVDDVVEYIPDFRDNRQLSDDEQVVVTIKMPTARDQNFIYKQGGDGISFDFPLAVQRFVTRVKNLTVNVSGHRTVVETGRDMVGIPKLSLLVDDIGAYILSLLRETADADPT